MSRLKDAETCTKVLTLLENLANGWRQPQSKKNLYVHRGASSQLLEQYKVKGLLHLVWTVDILKENSNYIQILKVWDILPLSEMPKLANQLDVLFENYTLEKINHCKHRSLSGYASCLNSFLSTNCNSILSLIVKNVIFEAKLGKCFLFLSTIFEPLTMGLTATHMTNHQGNKDG